MTTPPPTRVGVKVGFTFSWRGASHSWGQLYHFDGPTSWADQTHFDTFAVNLWNQIKQPLPARVTCNDMTAYNAGSFLPVFNHTIAAAGGYTDTSNPQAAGELCMLWRFTTDQRTTKNHPIYLFKWFHGMQTDGATSPDSLRAGIVATAATPISSLLSGISDGTNSRKYCGPRGAVALSGTCYSTLHAREFPT